MLARGILESGRTHGVSFRPFQNSSGWWWLISSLFLIRISCHKTTHTNGYYGTWPGWAVSISVLPLTNPPERLHTQDTSWELGWRSLSSIISSCCAWAQACLVEQKSLFTWSKLGCSTSETSFYPCSNSNFVGPSQRWNRQEPNRRPNRMVISGPRKQKATFGMRVAGFVTLFDWLVVRQQSCAPGILCSVWSYHLPPGWGAQRHCYAYFFE